MSSIRVIAGRFGGRLLDTPKDNNTRTKPMGERIRNAMFNSIGNEINGAQVLDAFAGTGAVGLEALSRGAAHATFIERDKIAQKILSNNVSSLGVQNEAKIISAPVSFPQSVNFLGFSNQAGLWYYHIQEEVRNQIWETKLLWWTIVVMEMLISPLSAESREFSWLWECEDGSRLAGYFL